MKTRFLLFSLMIIAFISHGQTIFLKFGPSFSNIKEQIPSDYISEIGKDIIGFDAIVGVNYLNFKYFNLSSGIGFIQKGGTVTQAIHGNDPTWHNDTARLNFLTINTTFNLKIPIIKFIEPYIFFGPRLDYLFSYSEKNGYLFKDYDYYKKLNKVIYGILLGGGINFKVKRFQLGLGFDYYINMNKLVDYSQTNYVTGYGGTGSWEYTSKISDNTFTINALIGFKF
jgi:hypothetical protein